MGKILVYFAYANKGKIEIETDTMDFPHTTPI